VKLTAEAAPRYYLVVNKTSETADGDTVISPPDYDAVGNNKYLVRIQAVLLNNAGTLAASIVVGNGKSISATGTGTIVATGLAGLTLPGSGTLATLDGNEVLTGSN